MKLFPRQISPPSDLCNQCVILTQSTVGYHISLAWLSTGAADLATSQTPNIYTAILWKYEELRTHPSILQSVKFANLDDIFKIEEYC